MNPIEWKKKCEKRTKEFVEEQKKELLEELLKKESIEDENDT